MNLEKALRKKIEGLIPSVLFVAKVKEVDETNYTCDVIPVDSEAEIFTVRLKPTIDAIKKGIIAIPAKDSFVIIGLLNKNKNSAFVVWCSTIKKYYIIGDGGNTLEFKDDGTILINGDDYEGLVKVNDLVDRMNKIESAHNNHLTLYGTHVHLGGTISGSTGITTPDITNTLVQTVKSDIENEKVKHGTGN